MIYFIGECVIAYYVLKLCWFLFLHVIMRLFYLIVVFKESYNGGNIDQAGTISERFWAIVKGDWHFLEWGHTRPNPDEE